MRNYKSWTSLEVAFLRENAALGRSELARLLTRSEFAVECMARRYRISLRREVLLCPSCGRFPVPADSESGWCLVCDLRAAMENRRAELVAEAEARAAQVAERQRKHRVTALSG